MSGDLISREALKKKFERLVDETIPYGGVAVNDMRELIDNAPTVYPICEDKACKYRANERPQGEWVVHSCYKDVIICSNCNSGDSRWHKDFKFCPNCGADMRKGGAEE